mgnify:FL=1
MNIIRKLILVIFVSFWSCKESHDFVDLNKNSKMDIFEDPNLEATERAKDILSYLSIEEKIAQLESSAPSIPKLGITKYNWMNEALHGIRGDHGEVTTVFPQAIGLAATWNIDLARQQGEAISDEARALANERGHDRYLDFWSPVINIGRDPRWGRTQEGYGEDPVLVSQISKSFIQGLQGNHPKYFKVLSAPKHFVANNEEYRRHSGSSEVPMEVLRDYYLPAFKSSIVNAGAQSIMTAYNALNGIPCTANNFLLHDILRNEWNFPGWVVTDCGAIYDIHINHKYIIDPVEAVAASLKAGTDLNCGSSFRLYLHEAFERGLVNMNDIDQALTRLFISRIKLGVFDPPEMNPYSKISLDVVDSEKHQSLAHEIARQSIVLLKNENEILPLKKAVRSIAVIGPNANFSRFGTYSGTPSVNITPLEGIKTVIPDAKIVYSQGTTILEAELPTMPDDLFYTPEGISGVKAEYFVGFDMEVDPILIRTEKSPNISWEFDKTPDSTLFEPNYFSVRFSGNIIVKESGNYKINVNGIDGLKFSFMENELIDKMSENYSHTTFKTDYLIKGKPYPFSLEYFEDEGWGEVRLGIAPIKKGLIEDAISKAKSSELVIMVLGTYDYIESEGRDRAETDLPLDQKNLLKKVYEVNQNLILVMVNGSTISLPWASKNIPAIVEAWYPGQSGGKAIAEVLFGEVNPGGKLPMTFYKNIDQLPPFDDYDIRKGRTYMYLKEDPLYPFGYGLSYTNFSITQISLNNEEFSIKDTIKVNFTLQNIGSRKGSEVPQIYIEHNGVKKLKSFNRIFLESNESSEILFKIPISDLERWDSLGNEFSVSSGQYMIHLGTSSADLLFSQNFIVK